MKYSSRFFLYAPLAVFLAIAGGASYLWWHVASIVSARLDAMNGQEMARGVTLHFGSKTIGGFPFNLDVVFENFELDFVTARGPSTWRAEKFAVHALTYGREQIVFEASGHQATTWHDVQGKARALPFEIGSLHGSAIQGERGLSRVDIVVLGLESPMLNAGKAEVHARVAPGGGAIEVAGAIDAIRISPRVMGDSIFSGDIDRIRLNASATPAAPFDELRAGRMGWVSALESWRKANGALSVSDVEFSWHGISAKGHGSLSLDERHAVQGLIDFKVAGIQALLDIARRMHMEPDRFRGIGPALLARAAKAGANDAGLVGAVLVFHSGVVSIGDVNATDEEPLY